MSYEHVTLVVMLKDHSSAGWRRPGQGRGGIHSKRPQTAVPDRLLSTSLSRDSYELGGRQKTVRLWLYTHPFEISAQPLLHILSVVLDGTAWRQERGWEWEWEGVTHLKIRVQCIFSAQALFRG